MPKITNLTKMFQLQRKVLTLEQQRARLDIEISKIGIEINGLQKQDGKATLKEAI